MILVLISGLLAILITLFVLGKYEVLTKALISNTKVRCYIACFSVATMFFFYLLGRQDYRWITIMNIVMLYPILAMSAGIDLKIYKIPNRLILVGLVIRTVLLIIEACLFQETIKRSLFTSIGGGLFAFSLMMILSFVTKRGIGYGDVKLFTLIGYCLGISDTYSVLFYSVLFAAIVGIYLLFVKKCSRKQKIPFAPFIYMGAYAVFIMSFI